MQLSPTDIFTQAASENACVPPQLNLFFFFLLFAAPAAHSLK